MLPLVPLAGVSSKEAVEREERCSGVLACVLPELLIDEKVWMAVRLAFGDR